MKTVYVENDKSIRRMFTAYGWEIADSIYEADLLCLEGGADVTPAIYGEKNTSSYNNTQKDIHSMGLIAIAVRRGIPVTGICRGSQILNVYHNGKMKQHIDGHGRDHELVYEGISYLVSSTHLQESVPDVDEQEIVRAPDGTVEMVFYEQDKGLRHMGVQFHPEYYPYGHQCPTLFFKALERIL